MKDKFSKLKNVYKKYGLKIFFVKLYAYIVANYCNKISFAVFFRKNHYRKIIQNILKSENYDRIILWRSSFGYDVPLYQRPQHISNNLAKMNCLVFYEVTTMTDKVKIIKKQNENLYLCNFNNILLNKLILEELSKIDKPKYVQLYSTDWKLTVEEIERYIKNGYKFIYEYIDDLSPELAGTKELPQNIIDKYEYAMNNLDTFVVVTADFLRQDVIQRRGEKNLIFSTNGVDYQFFKKFGNYQFEEEFTTILENGKINLCYYGALATWFDYELIKKIEKTDKYNIILFGIKYDESYENHLGSEKNIYFMGPRNYDVLKHYAKTVDILMIPFLLNDITKATSPVKLFEYMALQKPIVTTDMHECRKYKSVLIGKDHEDFLKQLETGYALKTDSDYLNLLDKEAQENDWSIKAKAIVHGVDID